ncbi:transporter substrate-binding domain-containing protein [Anaerobacillus sp. MEB173]|uniref:transporter substrate-binding domain-containing protein n=1 Tax=Anaerobacillus sp. MEB173 TaxID=3383345 RepID=UPI003F90A0AD
MRYRVFLLQLVLLLVCSTVAVAEDQATSELRVAFDPYLAPIQYLEDGEVKGFAIDLMNTIAQRNDITVIYLPMTIQESLQALKDHEVDIILGLHFLDRQTVAVDYTDPYFTSSIGLLVKADDEEIRGMNDLHRKMIAIQRGTLEYEFLRNIRGVRYNTVTNQENGLKLLFQKRTDAFVGDALVTETLLENYGLSDEYTFIGTHLLPIEYSMAVNLGNYSLVRMMNQGLRGMRSDGTYTELYNQWFKDNDFTNLLILVIEVIAVLLVIGLVLFGLAIRWNRKLKREVEKKTKDLAALNRSLKKQMVEERRLREQIIEQEKSRALSRIVAGIAHEIRNPLTSIKTFVELLPRKYNNERFQKEMNTLVPKEIDRLNQLIEGLINYAKPQKINREPVNLDTLLQEILLLFTTAINNKGYEIKSKIDPNCSIEVDRNQLKQVIINLIINAVDAMDEKQSQELLQITINAYQKAENVYIEVIDEGVGMTSEVLHNVFEPFYTTKAKGTGLGLSIAKQFVQENGGRFTIESEQGAGTIVTLIFEKAGGTYK